MTGYNHITLVGNLTKDPEQKKFENSSKVNMRLAVGGSKKKEDGSVPVDFIDVVAWNKLGELCIEYLEKGRRVLVDGKLHIHEYEQDSQKKWRTEVQADNVTFLDFPQNGSDNGKPKAKKAEK
ncbi:MAG: single-stranded DNA-binding protein [Candidatus Margulisiibacteriota bacterium]|jgi:single-strand DNA-binding protein